MGDDETLYPPLPVTPERWLTIEQALVVAGVTRRTIYNWMKEGRLRTKRTAGGSTRILEASLWRSNEDHSST